MTGLQSVYSITEAQVREIRNLAFRITDGAACDPAGTPMMKEIEKERDRIYEILDGLTIHGLAEVDG